MAKRNPVPFNTGVVRMVGGSCYTGSSKDDKGQPKVYKTGPQAGQPRTDYSVGIAVPKTQGHWASEPGFLAQIWAEGHAAWPNGQAQRHDFAWKIVDGDSQVPNKKGKKPCDQAGYPGHWIVWFGGTTPPQVADGRGIMEGKPPQWSSEPGLVMPGDYIEIRGSVSGNDSDQTAGVYINYDAVCLRGYHPDGRIAAQIDLATAGFGGALPAGASVAPVGNALQPPAPPMASGAPPVPGAAPAVTPPTPPVAPPVPPANAPLVPPATPVVPNPAILGAPAPVGVPPAPAPLPAPPTPPAPAARQMLPKANGVTYEAFKGNGWSDEALVAEGYMAP